MPRKRSFGLLFPQHPRRTLKHVHFQIGDKIRMPRRDIAEGAKTRRENAHVRQKLHLHTVANEADKNADSALAHVIV
jgi:hypothetical protein